MVSLNTSKLMTSVLRPATNKIPLKEKLSGGFYFSTHRNGHYGGNILIYCNRLLIDALLVAQ